MTTFIAFLRGINVGGKKRIRMADLKNTFESVGLIHVETFIQSGNVIFESDEKEDFLERTIEQAIQENFGASTPVILRTADQLETLIANCLFTEKEIAEAESANIEGESIYVALLARTPDPIKVEHLSKFVSEADAFALKDRDLYLLLRHSVRNSKLANSLQKLEVSQTVRNWKTMNQLLALTKGRA